MADSYLDKLIALFSAGQPAPSAPSPDPQAAWQKAQTIGPAKVGDRYLPTEGNWNLKDVVNSVIGPERPRSVQALDPTGVEAWEKGAGPMPVMAGTMKAWHGSPFDFEKFSDAKINSGVGAQAYGHGHYLAKLKQAGQFWRDRLSGPMIQVEGSPPMKDLHNLADRLTPDKGNVEQWQGVHDAFDHVLKGQQPYEGLADYWTFNQPIAGRDDLLKAAAADPGSYAGGWAHTAKLLEEQKANYLNNPGHLYQVKFDANPNQLLNWDATFKEQAPGVQEKLRDIVPADWQRPNANWRLDGGKMYEHLAERSGSPAKASKTLLAKGVPGATYKDYHMETGAGQNHVAYSGSLLDILKKYGFVGTAGLAEFLARQSPQQEQ